MTKSVLIITGEQNSGKTTMAYALCSRLDLDDYTIGGVIQVLALPGEPKDRYRLASLSDGTSTVFLDAEEHSSWSRIGRFSLNPEGLLWAQQQLQAAYSYDVTVFDEIGRLELNGEGFDGALSRALQGYEGNLMLIVREEFLSEVCLRYSIDRNTALIIRSTDDIDESYRRICAL